MSSNYFSDSFSAELYDYWMKASWQDTDIAFWTQLSPQLGPRVLILGFGTGRVGLLLAELKHEVVGVEREAAMLEVFSRKKLVEKLRTRISTVHRDIVALSELGTFSAIIAPVWSFDYLITKEQQKICLVNCYRQLIPEGVLVLNTWIPDVPEERVAHRQLLFDSPYGRMSREFESYFFEAEPLEARHCTFTIISTGEKRHYLTVQRHTAPTELSHLLQENSFLVSGQCDFNYHPWDHLWGNLCTVARKA